MLTFIFKDSLSPRVLEVKKPVSKTQKFKHF
jgi:hypothetical protein